MSEATKTAPVNGTCTQCGCALGYAAAEKAGSWYCCGACAGSDRCHCGCKPEFAAEAAGDLHIPTRRMFAARAADGLKTPPGAARDRAFPFSDKPRGR